MWGAHVACGGLDTPESSTAEAWAGKTGSAGACTTLITGTPPFSRRLLLGRGWLVRDLQVGSSTLLFVMICQRSLRAMLQCRLFLHAMRCDALIERLAVRGSEARGRAAGSGGRREEVEKSESSDATKVGSKKTKKKKKGLLTRVRARCKSRERERAEDRGGDSMEEEDHEREGGRDQDQEEEEEQYQGYDDRDDCDDHGVREDEQRRKQEPVKRESREEGVQVREGREEGIQVGGSGLWQKRQGLGGPGEVHADMSCE
eukprot:2020241-Rhodomonas_salina.2